MQTVFWQIAETYAFLPREAVTRFLMSCTECQKRMHFNSSGPEPKGGGHTADRSSRGQCGWWHCPKGLVWICLTF